MDGNGREFSGIGGGDVSSPRMDETSMPLTAGSSEKRKLAGVDSTRLFQAGLESGIPFKKNIFIRVDSRPFAVEKSLA